ncbi:MAG: M23 family metallopeptidase [Coriobacteriia bacterium]|nr:M23 family metallopeptidase [Coriobacteriia bacterium]
MFEKPVPARRTPVHARPPGALSCLVFVLACVLWPTGAALAAEGVWPVSSSEVLLGHAEPYTGPDGSRRTHSGADIAADAGEDVSAGLEGTVSFVGRVPAAAGGGTVLAVTVAAGDLKLTYLPLAEAFVAKGDGIAAGDVLGSAADAGDPSSAGAHVHVSVRRGELYVDPLGVLRPPAEAPPAAPMPPEAPAPSRAAVPPVGPQAAPAAGPRASAADAPAPRPGAVSAPAPAGVAAGVPPSTAAAPAPAKAAAEAEAEPPAVTAERSVVSRGAAGTADAAPVEAGGAATGSEGAVGLLGLGGAQVVGLRLPAAPEALLGIAASILLWLGLRVSPERSAGPAPCAVPAPCEGR